jgi:hypothetical protein
MVNSFEKVGTKAAPDRKSSLKKGENVGLVSARGGLTDEAFTRYIAPAKNAPV